MNSPSSCGGRLLQLCFAEHLSIPQINQLVGNIQFLSARTGSTPSSACPQRFFLFVCLFFNPAALSGEVSDLWSFFPLKLWYRQHDLGNLFPVGVGQPLVFVLVCFVLQFSRDIYFNEYLCCENSLTIFPWTFRNKCWHVNTCRYIIWTFKYNKYLAYVCILFVFKHVYARASLVAQIVKNLPAVQETQVWSLGLEDPWRRKWQPTPGFLPGEPHGQRSLVGYSPWSCKESDTTEQLSTHTFMCVYGGMLSILAAYRGFYIINCEFTLRLYLEPLVL